MIVGRQRTVVLGARLALEMSLADVAPAVLRGAMLLADVDQDGDQELVVGAVDGRLAVFKGASGEPCAVANDLGTITCMAVGPVCRPGYNLLAVTSGEGLCHLFAVSPAAGGGGALTLQPIAAVNIGENARAMVIGDVDGDGATEVVFAYADASIRRFRWSADSALLLPYGNPWEVPLPVDALALVHDQERSPLLVVTQVRDR